MSVTWTIKEDQCSFQNMSLKVSSNILLNQMQDSCKPQAWWGFNKIWNIFNYTNHLVQFVCLLHETYCSKTQSTPRASACYEKRKRNLLWPIWLKGVLRRIGFEGKVVIWVICSSVWTLYITISSLVWIAEK